MINALILTTIAGLATLLGSSVIFFVKKQKPSYLNIAMGFAAGVMIFVSLTELLNESIENIGYLKAILSFFAGIIIIYLIDVFIPHSYEAETCSNSSIKEKHKLKRCGIMVAVGIAIHNFPEGIAVFFSSVLNIKLGIAIALAIALHNIPEGIAVAMPIYYATGSRIQAFWYSFLSGIAEPIGAILAFVFLQSFLTLEFLSIIIGAVAGIMVFISFDELLPFAYKQEDSHVTILGIFLGMGLMALSLYFL